MTKPDASIVLLRLLDVAERILTCRATDIPIELWGDVAALQSPVGVVLSAAPGLLLRALQEARCARDQAMPWFMVAGCLLPMVRDDLSRVIEARRRPLEEISR